MEAGKGYGEKHALRIARTGNEDVALGNRAIMTHMDPKNPFLRHALATLAYRAARATENAPPEFADYETGSNPKTPVQVLAHMGDLMDWSLTLIDGHQKWHDAKPLAWTDELTRFFVGLKRLDDRIAAFDLTEAAANRLFQGPIADALTHTGQIAMLRRMAGCPVRGENYYIAEVTAGHVGPDQPAPRKSF